jgi:hypothetical protein
MLLVPTVYTHGLKIEPRKVIGGTDYVLFRDGGQATIFVPFAYYDPKPWRLNVYFHRFGMGPATLEDLHFATERALATRLLPVQNIVYETTGHAYILVRPAPPEAP